MNTRMSVLNTLKLMTLVMLPSYTQGLFTRRRFWVSLWSRLNVDARAIGLVSRMRRRHGTTLVLGFGSPTRIVTAPEDIQKILDESPALYLGADSKIRGMSHFQPNAVTISAGEEWRERRRFNEAVLDTERPLHHHADRFLAVTQSAVRAMQKAAGPRLTWTHFDELFEQIGGGVLFGEDPAAADPMFERLGKLMRESNRVFGLRKSRHFDPFYEDIRQQLKRSPADSLVGRCTHTSSTATTRVENQIPHWMFAIRETLAANTIRALALIVAHPASEQRVQDDLRAIRDFSPESIRSLAYLEGCVQEAMRLWPTTPIIARKAARDGEQVLILNTFNHRDAESDITANAFHPEQWIGERPKRPFNHLSGGPQECAGKHLALFLAKSVLAVLLQGRSYRLRKPRLNPAKPLPAMYNYFRLEFDRR